MLLSKLYINEEIFCDFHEGLNIIIAYNHKGNITTDDKITSDTNGVGKSIIVNLIKKILGGDVETIFDSDYYLRKKIVASLEIYNTKGDYFVIGYSFQEKLADYKIVYKGQFDLYKRDVINKPIQNVRTPFEFQELFKTNANIVLKNKTEFTKFINQFENIDYSKTNITFNALLDFIIRDEKNGFSDIISRIRRSQKVQYRTIQYLFNLPYAIEEKIQNINQIISDNKTSIESKRKILSSDGIKTISNIENQRINLNRDLEKIRKEKSALRTSKSIEAIRKEYKENRSQLIKINTLINEKEHQIINYEENISILGQKEQEISKLLDIEAFYTDLLGIFPEKVAKNLNDYQAFIESISRDRLDYFETAKSQTEIQLKTLKDEKKIIQKNVDSISVKMNGFEIVDDIALISEREKTATDKLERLDLYESELKNIETIIEINDRLEDDRKKILLGVKAINSEITQQRKKIIELFQEIIFKVYQNPDCYLNFDFISNVDSSICGRTEIECSIPSDKSHGRTNAKICLFDFTWFLFDSNLYNPDFLIHDGPYSKISKEVKHRMLQLIKTKISSKRKQYIITINESELPYLEEYKDHFSKELNGDNERGKFFKEQFDE